MIIDEYLLVFVHSQEEPIPPRATTRSKSAAARRTIAARLAGIPEPEAKIENPGIAMHSIDELSLIGCIDAMPVMQSNRRTRAPANMAARPRLGRPRSIPQVVPGRRSPDAASKRRSKSSVAGGGGEGGGHPTVIRSRAAAAAKPQDIDDLGQKKVQRRKPLTLESSEVRPRGKHVTVTCISLITNLATPDTLMKLRALEIASKEIKSEPVLPINTAIRVVLQATLDLGRPYDTNMLAATFGVTRSLVMQSLRKHYEGFMEQSLFTGENFVPTYLWLYGLGTEQVDIQRVNKAIKLSGADKPGSRSVFAIARDFVILYVSEVVYGIEAKAELAGLSSVAAVMGSIKSPPEVPLCFLEMTNSFLYRARMTGRSVMKVKTDLVRQCGGTISGLFMED